MKKITISKNIFFLTYKLLHDALFLLLLTLGALLIAEGLLPGFVSAHISLARVVLVLLANIIAIAWLGKQLHIAYPDPQVTHSKIAPFLVIGAFLLIGNSLLKFKFWENMLITLVTMVVFFLFYKIILSAEE